ncbi:MAG TPA: glycosyltransferase family 2 protein, partial [Flavobacterium sp.]|nr:glycosyltransferase family 2 protein [Flavobacterium sp.]
MNYSVIIPAHNEEAFIALTLQSLLAQTILPSQVVVVDDNSKDLTSAVVSDFVQRHSFISLVRNQSDAAHLPGSKVIRAFQKGFELIKQDYDIIVKLDADLILPSDYFEKVIAAFKSDSKIGMAGGFAYIEKNGQWILENLTDKDHIRGAFKAYRRECFVQIGGLRPAMGWDTVDELLTKFYGWKV